MATNRDSATTKPYRKAKPKSGSAKAKVINAEIISDAEVTGDINAKPTVKLSVVEESAAPTEPDPVLRKRELLDAVITKSGVRKRDAKPVVEAMLAVLASALQDGRAINLQPLGKFSVKNEKKLENGKVLTAKIRQVRDLLPNDISSEADGK